MYATNLLEMGFLDVMRGNTLAGLSTPYLALFLSDPTESGSAGVEIAYSGYERQVMAFSEPVLAGSTVSIRNEGQISFPMSEIDSGTVTHIGIYDSQVAGNMWLYGKLSEPLIVGAGEAPIVLAGEIEYYLSGNLSIEYKRRLLDILRGIAIQGVTPHMALFSGNPDTLGAELAGDNYSRPAVEFAAASESESGQMKMQNARSLAFNRPTTSWGTWGYTAIMDSESNGHPIWVQVKTPPIEIKKGYMPLINEGALTVSIN